MVRPSSFAAVLLVACGGATASSVESADPIASDAPREEEVSVPPSDANAFIPGFALRLPSRPVASEGIELKSETEVEEITFVVADEGESIDSIVAEVGETMGLIAGMEAPIVDTEAGGHRAKSVAVLGEEGGQRFFMGFAVVDLDGSVLRISYTTADADHGQERMQRVMDSLSSAYHRPTDESLVVTGLGAVFLEVPAGMPRVRIHQHYPDRGTFSLAIRPPPSEGETSLRDSLTRNEVGQARRVENVQTREQVVAGLAGEITDMDVIVSEERSREHLVEATLGDGRLLHVQARDLPDDVRFDELLASVRPFP